MLPLPPNTTCDIYHSPNAPPSAPDVAGVSVHLRPDFVQGQEHGDRASSDAITWTHILLVDASVDIRDGYSGGGTFATNDTLYVPDKDGTPYYVIFIERLRTSAGDFKRVYLDRQAPTWPTSEL